MSRASLQLIVRLIRRVVTLKIGRGGFVRRVEIKLGLRAFVLRCFIGLCIEFDIKAECRSLWIRGS